MPGCTPEVQLQQVLHLGSKLPGQGQDQAHAQHSLHSLRTGTCSALREHAPEAQSDTGCTDHRPDASKQHSECGRAWETRTRKLESSRADRGSSCTQPPSKGQSCCQRLLSDEQLTACWHTLFLFSLASKGSTMRPTATKEDAQPTMPTAVRCHPHGTCRYSMQCDVPRHGERRKASGRHMPAMACCTAPSPAGPSQQGPWGQAAAAACLPACQEASASACLCGRAAVSTNGLTSLVVMSLNLRTLLCR